MGRPRILDQKIMSKIAKKLGKNNVVLINKLVSRRASKLGISSEAALILLAKEQGIGTATYQRSLDDAKRAEVREALPAIVASISTKPTNGTSVMKKTPVSTNKRAALKSMVEYLLQDDELRSRCSDLLLAGSKFDRPINQATLVLEERIRTRAQPPTAMVGENLVNYAFKENLTKTILQVAGGDPDEQRGFVQILRGVVPAFRNRTHHHVIDTFTREDAIRVCCFIDVLIRVVDGATKVR